MIIYVILLSWIISEDTPGTLVASIHLQYWSRRLKNSEKLLGWGQLSLPAPSRGLGRNVSLPKTLS